MMRGAKHVPGTIRANRSLTSIENSISDSNFRSDAANRSPAPVVNVLEEHVKEQGEQHSLEPSDCPASTSMNEANEITEMPAPRRERGGFLGMLGGVFRSRLSAAL